MGIRIGGVGIDTNDLAASTAFWQAATGYRVTSSDAASTYLTAPEGAGPHLFLQVVPERPTGKNRLHLDLVTGDVAGEVDRLQGLGATEVGRHDGWVVLADPDGNQFCVVGS
ncbi:VOC family protein [Micromonospora coxensis]|uniref:Glyoxalase-like domain-containing protein n=1 Tax=Micromonospora coxensis TaxID=356852 RepID=A0A1C5HGF3_9ACTN|nr:VOC family protein [Micromonospora coxensis]SCG45096.1 Glyoxalase-like domain-containing protein [Micromonospora coxensis]